MSLHRSHFLQQLQRIELRRHFAKLGLRDIRDTFRLQEAFAWGQWRMIALGHLCAVAMLLGELEGRLEEVHEQPGGSIEARDCPCGRQSFEAPVTQKLPYDGSVLLLDPRLVVFSVR